MSMLNRSGYRKLIEEDVNWLKQQPRTLEREHIEAVLWDSIEALYERPRMGNCRAERLWSENRIVGAATLAALGQEVKDG